MGKSNENEKNMNKRKAERKKKEKPQYNAWQNSWFMIKLAWQTKEKKILVLCLLVATFAVLKNLLELYVVPSVLSVVERKAPVEEILLTIFIYVGGMVLVSAGAAYVGENTLFGRVSLRMRLLGMINAKFSITSYPNLFDEKLDKLHKNATEAIGGNDRAGEAIWKTLTELLKNVTGFVIYMILLVSVKPMLLGVVLITTLLGHVVNNKANDYKFKHRDEESESVRQMTYVRDRISEYNGAKDIRIFGLKPWLEELFDKAMSVYEAFHGKMQTAYLWAKVAEVVLTFVRNGIAYVYLLYLVLDQGLEASEFLLYFSAVSGFAVWVLGILDNLSVLRRQSIDLNAVRECLDYPEPFVFAEGERLEPEQGQAYEIKLDKVSFRYPGMEKDILKDVNLTLHAGENLAIVGLNGAGKTTLVKLICGFLDPTEGQVLLNGVDIRTYNRADYYRMFSAVFQKFCVVAGTVANNIAQSMDDIDMEKVKICAEKAGISERIESLAEKYNTLLNREVYDEAVMMSGGESQRLMLARALYKDAPIIVLDEPTAALDPIAEYEMYQRYNQMTQGKSSVYISHRLASTRFCDRIILLDDNIISEEGTHETLMQKGGKYAELFAVQSKYYHEEEDADNE